MLARLRSYLPTAALALLIFYFGFHAFTGDRGLLTSTQRDETLSPRPANSPSCRPSARIWRSAPGCCATPAFRADLLEERARSLLGFADPRDYVIRMKP